MERNEELLERGKQYWVKKKKPFEEAMQHKFGVKWERIWDSAYKALHLGNVRLLIVSDEIPDYLKRSIIFLGKNFLLSALDIVPL
ncbi:MAG: hypothetical protein ABIH42_04915 [Planctomycetota bacterium]